MLCIHYFFIKQKRLLVQFNMIIYIIIINTFIYILYYICASYIYDILYNYIIFNTLYLLIYYIYYIFI